MKPFNCFLIACLVAPHVLAAGGGGDRSRNLQSRTEGGSNCRQIGLIKCLSLLQLPPAVPSSVGMTSMLQLSRLQEVAEGRVRAQQILD